MIKTYFIKFSENYNPFLENIDIFFTNLILQIIWNLFLLDIGFSIKIKKGLDLTKPFYGIYYESTFKTATLISSITLDSLERLLDTSISRFPAFSK